MTTTACTTTDCQHVCRYAPEPARGTLLGSNVAEHASHATQRLIALWLADELQRQRYAGREKANAAAAIMVVALAGRCAVIQRGLGATASCLADITV